MNTIEKIITVNMVFNAFSGDSTASTQMLSDLSTNFGREEAIKLAQEANKILCEHYYNWEEL